MKHRTKPLHPITAQAFFFSDAGMTAIRKFYVGEKANDNSKNSFAQEFFAAITRILRGAIA